MSYFDIRCVKHKGNRVFSKMKNIKPMLTASLLFGFIVLSHVMFLHTIKLLPPDASIVHWTDESQTALIHRQPVHANEIVRMTVYKKSLLHENMNL